MFPFGSFGFSEKVWLGGGKVHVFGPVYFILFFLRMVFTSRFVFDSRRDIFVRPPTKFCHKGTQRMHLKIIIVLT